MSNKKTLERNLKLLRYKYGHLTEKERKSKEGEELKSMIEAIKEQIKLAKENLST